MKRLAFIIILGSIVLSNTFSPQFLIWAAPFVAFLTIPEILMFTGASSLTWIYFSYWDDLIKLYPVVTNVLIARNILLVILLVTSIVIFLIETIKNRE